MEDSLLRYLNGRMGLKEKSLSPEDILPGPVVTISREVGCAGVKLANQLAQKLNEQGGSHKWKVFSKEIFKEAARELEMDHQKLGKILKTQERNTFDEILGALSDKRFKSERKIQKTVIDFIRTVASDGYCIIVGRGGHLITRDIENSLHIRLSAPLDWRIKKIVQRDHLSEAEAKKFIDATEKERESIRKKIEKEASATEHFDIQINVSSFNSGDLVDIIQKTMTVKGLATVPKIVVAPGQK